MAGIDEVVLERARRALLVLAGETPVVESYLFGSHLSEEADAWSDIDIAVFLEDAEAWDIERRAVLSARVQRLAGDDIEIHVFPAGSDESGDPSSFANHVRRVGVRLEMRP
jgi:predicted nucleotidyltransferase